MGNQTEYGIFQIKISQRIFAAIYGLAQIALVSLMAIFLICCVIENRTGESIQDTFSDCLPWFLLVLILLKQFTKSVLANTSRAPGRPTSKLSAFSGPIWLCDTVMWILAAILVMGTYYQIDSRTDFKTVSYYLLLIWTPCILYYFITIMSKYYVKDDLRSLWMSELKYICDWDHVCDEENKLAPPKDDLDKLELKIYLDAVVQAGNRIRGSIYTLAILSILLIMTSCGSFLLNWNGLRVHQVDMALQWTATAKDEFDTNKYRYDKAMAAYTAAQAAYEKNPTKQQPPQKPQGIDFDSYFRNSLRIRMMRMTAYQERSIRYANHIVLGRFLVDNGPRAALVPKTYDDLEQLNAEYRTTAQALINKQINAWAFSLPLIGSATDNNSVGIFVGLTLIAGLFVFRLHLWQCIHQLRAAIKAAEKETARKNGEVKRYMERAAVLTGTDKTPGTKLVIGLVAPFLPFLSFLFYFATDTMSRSTTFTLLAPKGGVWLYGVELGILLTIAELVRINTILLLPFVNEGIKNQLLYDKKEDNPTSTPEQNDIYDTNLSGNNKIPTQISLKTSLQSVMNTLKLTLSHGTAQRTPSDKQTHDGTEVSSQSIEITSQPMYTSVKEPNEDHSSP